MTEHIIKIPPMQTPATYVMMAELASRREDFERSARLYRSAAASTTNQQDWVKFNELAVEMWGKAGLFAEFPIDIPHSSDDDEY